MSDVLVLVQGPYGACFAVQVPEGVEDDAFRARVEAETGLRAAGYAYTTTLPGLRREIKASKMTGNR